MTPSVRRGSPVLGPSGVGEAGRRLDGSRPQPSSSAIRRPTPGVSADRERPPSCADCAISTSRSRPARRTFAARIAAAAKTPERVGDPLAFHVVAATIIPVLFLALAHQANVVDEYRDKPALMAVTAFFRVAYAAWGEATALQSARVGPWSPRSVMS